MGSRPEVSTGGRRGMCARADGALFEEGLENWNCGTSKKRGAQRSGEVQGKGVTNFNINRTWLPNHRSPDAPEL